MVADAPPREGTVLEVFLEDANGWLTARDGHGVGLIEDHCVVRVERGELLLETEVSLGCKETLHEREGRGEEHPVAPLNQLVADCADEVGLATARQPEGEQGPQVGALGVADLSQRLPHIYICVPRLWELPLPEQVRRCAAFKPA